MQRVRKGTEDAVQRCSKRRWKKRGVNVHQGTKKERIKSQKKTYRNKMKGREHMYMYQHVSSGLCMDMQLWNTASADRMDDHRSVSIVHIQLYVTLHRKDYLTIRSCSINVYKCVSGLLLNKFSCPHINLYKKHILQKRNVIGSTVQWIYSMITSS